MPDIDRIGFRKRRHWQERRALTLIYWLQSKYSRRERKAMGMDAHNVRAFAISAGMPLRLIPMIKAFPPQLPTDPHWGADDYAVFDGERHVGRLYRATSTAAEQWWWGIKAELRRTGVRGDGQEHTREAAMAAFKRAWEAR